MMCPGLGAVAHVEHERRVGETDRVAGVDCCPRRQRNSIAIPERRESPQRQERMMTTYSKKRLCNLYAEAGPKGREV
jgi:hypothetical protein